MYDKSAIKEGSKLKKHLRSVEPHLFIKEMCRGIENDRLVVMI